ncbi:hypothetical protein Dimus_000376, partial [Dionaea muscipula]
RVNLGEEQREAEENTEDNERLELRGGDELPEASENRGPEAVTASTSDLLLDLRVESTAAGVAGVGRNSDRDEVHRRVHSTVRENDGEE